jgi:hypothetical protein
VSVDLQREAIDLVRDAEAAGLTLRLFGGTAVQILVRSPLLTRPMPGDIDCVGLSSELPALLCFFSSRGYQENDAVCRLFGTHRRAFEHSTSHVRVDLSLNVLLFARSIDLRRRLASRPVTLSVADLLLSKLQPKEIADKDVVDVINLLGTFTPAGQEGDGRFNLRWFADACSRDWGLFQLVHENLETVRCATAQVSSPAREKVASGIAIMLDELTKFPKSIWWTLRALLGKRLDYWNDVAVEYPE